MPFKFSVPILQYFIPGHLNLSAVVQNNYLCFEKKGDKIV